MSYKRSRATYEADLHAPFATFGTPLPDEAETRDDGSYVPLWKQEVRDDRGRKRLHGAFTGGWSAGYFNTVGSKEGWTPSTFVSSRTNRRKDAVNDAQQQQRPEDYMDEEDLADAAEAQKLQTSQAFAGLGLGTRNEAGAGGLTGLFKTGGDTMGLKLLRKMGWKDGQGIGPKVRRSARLDMGNDASSAPNGEIYLFAPEDVQMVQFVRKVDRNGLGHKGGARLSSAMTSAADEDDEDDLHDDNDARPSSFFLGGSKPKPKAKRGGIGVGILNDDGSDEEDPYEIGPKIKYNRVIGGDKKKSKKGNAVANPTLRSKPAFIPKLARVGNGPRRCHDGRLPLDGFVLAKVTEDLSSLLLSYAPPSVPEGWVSKKLADGATSSSYTSTADAAKASTHDPKSRAAILGEKSLPGKSVFDYLSSTARDRLAAGSGRQDLPRGLGEIPAEFALTEEQKQQMLWDQAPKLERETAIVAISRGSGGPYADDKAKKYRYQAYLEHFATGSRPLPSKPQHMSDDDFLRELNEFYNCARIFKPMTGFMASRFTTAKTTSTSSTDGKPGSELLSKPEPKVLDPAEEAAKVGMYGAMTRSVEDFFPTRLLCKRFNVKPPAHSRPDQEEPTSKGPDAWPSFERAEDTSSPAPNAGKVFEPAPSAPITIPNAEANVAINPDKNDAVEDKAAHDEGRLPEDRSRDCHRTLSARSYHPAATLSASQEAGAGPSASLEFDTTRASSRRRDLDSARHDTDIDDNDNGNDTDSDVILSREQSPPPQYPASEASSSRPPPFSSLFCPPSDAAVAAAHGKFPAVADDDHDGDHEAEASGSVVAAPAYESTQDQPFDPDQTARAFCDPVAETKRALPRDTKAGGGHPSSRKDDSEAEPPPAYSEGDSPLLTFTYLMAAAGGASSIITQVQQGGPPVNTIGDVGADETIAMDLRGTRFYLSRDELLTLPEFVLLSLFPNGLFPEGQMGGFSENDAVQVDYDPASLQYMLDFFRNVAQSIPSESSPGTSQDGDVVPLEPMGARDDSSKRAGIIVLREDLDFYAIPPRSDIGQDEMILVKRAAARALQKQDGIFSGLKRSDEPGTTEAHLIEMLTAGGFNHDDRWGHRAGEPNKAVICSLALARLRSDIRGNEMGSNAVGMAQKLLLFWRKPARRCWWEGVELEGINGVEGKLKVWIRRVWTLEMSVIGLR